jgi:hypothetical protein
MKNTSRPPLLPAQREGAAHAQPAVHLCPGRAAPATPNEERGYNAGGRRGKRWERGSGSLAKPLTVAVRRYVHVSQVFLVEVRRHRVLVLHQLAHLPPPPRGLFPSRSPGAGPPLSGDWRGPHRVSGEEADPEHRQGAADEPLVHDAPGAAAARGRRLRAARRGAWGRRRGAPRHKERRNAADDDLDGRDERVAVALRPRRLELLQVDAVEPARADAAR